MNTTKKLILMLLPLLLAVSLFACTETPSQDAESVSLTEEITEAPTETETEEPEETETETETESETEPENVEYPEELSAEAREALSRSIVKIYCYNYDGKSISSEGTGIFIDTDGTFITNAHVVRNAYFVKAMTADKVMHDVNIMHSYTIKGSDHAILRAENCESEPATFVKRTNVGETIYAFAYSGGSEALSITEGTVMGEPREIQSANYIPNSAKITDGNSGGALVNTRGEVIGITTGYKPPEEYLALSYDEFSADLKATEREEKTLFSYFHTKREIELSFNNIDDIFEIFTAEDNQKTLKIKDRLKNERVGVLEKITLTLTLSDGTTLDFTFENEEEIKTGKPLDLGTKTAEFGEATGKIVFYNTFLAI